MHAYKGLRWFYTIFWPGGLLTFNDPFFLIMVSQPENLFFPRVIFLKSGTTLRRHQIKLHSYRAKVQWGYNKEKNLLSLRSNVININVNTYFSYMLVIFINVYKGRGYGDLAANIGLTMKNLHQYDF